MLIRDESLVRTLNRQSRLSWRRTAADVLIRGYRNDRRGIKDLVAKGEDEFIRLAKGQAGYRQFKFRKEDYQYIFRRLQALVNLLNNPHGRIQ
jgi:hypothetical protein